MAKTLRDNQVTERLRDWIEESYGHRGKFTTLEAASGIPAQRWKNVYYKRQFVTNEMLEFVHKNSTDSYQWITTGVETPKPNGYPFGTKPPTNDEQQTLAGRLIWTIKEWASPRGADLFKYLESRSERKVNTEQWAAMVLGTTAPTLEMLEVVCSHRPHLTEWIVNGGGMCTLDPANNESVKKWQQLQQAKFDAIASTFQEKHSTEKSS